MPFFSIIVSGIDRGFITHGILMEDHVKINGLPNGYINEYTI